MNANSQKQRCLALHSKLFIKFTKFASTYFTKNSKADN